MFNQASFRIPTRLLQLFRLGVLLSLLGTNAVAASEPEIRLWPKSAPGSETWKQKEVRFHNPQSGREAIRNVVEPTLTIFQPPAATANGSAVIVCPGGAFQIISWQLEGTDIAKWLNERGITAFVLKYRLADTGETDSEFQQKSGDVFRKLSVNSDRAVAELAPAAAIAAADGRRAVDLVRRDAAQWNIRPDRIGLLGFSAGAAIAIDVAVDHESSSRPDFIASIYGPGLRGSVVPQDAPPIFIACASDDRVLPSYGSLEVYTAWRKSGHPAEMHVYNKGGHGFGINKRGFSADHWVDQFQSWLGEQGVLVTPASKP